MAEEPKAAVMEVNPVGISEGAKTSDFYRTKNIPARFDNPEWFQGYSQKPVHPMYRTTNSNYGKRAPTVHTMPTSFNGKSQQFSEKLGKCGNYRNHSLNCAMDKTNVPTH